MSNVIPILISCAALVFSVYVFINNHKQDRRNVLLKMHEILASSEHQRGRYILFEKVIDESSVETLCDEEYRDINGALTAFNLLGIYVKNGYVDERDVLDAWGVSILRTWLAAKPFVAHREHKHGYNPHIYFEQLAHKAQEYLADKGIAQDIVIWRRSNN